MGIGVFLTISGKVLGVKAPLIHGGPPHQGDRLTRLSKELARTRI
jgi:hypothetical protein